jgi:HD-GYP domain-containing protein (c-di-GMP phosphodiesterase class II)
VEFRGIYKPVPKWTSSHHELLDGSGYPEHLRGDAIPTETRLLTILDIYDALTAEDRPYKPPLSAEKAFSIMRDMAGQGKIDSEILESFYASGAWKHDAS